MIGSCVCKYTMYDDGLFLCMKLMYVKVMTLFSVTKRVYHCF